MAARQQRDQQVLDRVAPARRSPWRPRARIASASERTSARLMVVIGWRPFKGVERVRGAQRRRKARARLRAGGRVRRRAAAAHRGGPARRRSQRVRPSAARAQRQSGARPAPHRAPPSRCSRPLRRDQPARVRASAPCRMRSRGPAARGGPKRANARQPTTPSAISRHSVAARNGGSNASVSRFFAPPSPASVRSNTTGRSSPSRAASTSRAASSARLRSARPWLFTQVGLEHHGHAPAVRVAVLLLRRTEPAAASSTG